MNHKRRQIKKHSFYPLEKSQMVNVNYLDCIKHYRDGVACSYCLTVPLALASAPMPQFTIIESPSVFTIAKSL